MKDNTQTQTVQFLKIGTKVQAMTANFGKPEKWEGGIITKVEFSASSWFSFDPAKSYTLDGPTYEVTLDRKNDKGQIMRKSLSSQKVMLNEVGEVNKRGDKDSIVITGKDNRCVW